MPRLAARFGVATFACLCATALLPAVAFSSELIGRNATNVRLQVDAKGHALVSFRSGGSPRTVVAWGAVDARKPSRTQQQVAFSLTVGGAIGPNVCGSYRGPSLAWRVAACTAPDGTHWAVQAWQRTLPNYGAPPTGETGAWELHLSHWSGPLPVLEISTDWSYRRFHHLYGRLTYGGEPVFGFRSTRTDGTSTSTRSAPRTAPAGSARTASSRTTRPGRSVTASIPTERRASGRGTAIARP